LQIESNFIALWLKGKRWHYFAWMLSSWLDVCWAYATILPGCTQEQIAINDDRLSTPSL
jgi:hypothetical protein